MTKSNRPSSNSRKSTNSRVMKDDNAMTRKDDVRGSSKESLPTVSIKRAEEKINEEKKQKVAKSKAK